MFIALAALHERADGFERVLGVFEVHDFVTQSSGGRSNGEEKNWKVGTRP